MNNNYRVLLHAVITKRDIGSLYILSKLLENFGCECFIAGTNSYASKITRLWNPHAVIHVTLNRTEVLSDLYPNADLFYYSGEGGESYEFSMEKRLAEDENFFNKITSSYLWGESTKNHIIKRIDELKNKSFLYKKKDLIESRIKVMGHPRLDIIKYFPIVKSSKQKKINIGLVGSFNMLNSLTLGKSSTVRRVFNGSDSDEVVFQATLLNSYAKIINSLNPDKYRISIRPYPLEDIKQYLSSKWVENGRVQVDQSIEFGVWAVQQDIIVGPTSSTLSQIAISKKPFINLDALNNRSTKAYKDSMRGVFIDHLETHCPKTYNDLFKMIENYRNLIVTNKEFDILMNNLYNCDQQHSCLLSVAKDIVQNLNRKKNKIRKGIPKKVMTKLHDLKYDKKEAETTYGYFSYRKIKDSLKSELDSIVNNILKSI